MKNYIVYDKTTGLIRANIQCIPEDIEIQCGENEVWMQAGPVVDAEYKVDVSTMEIVPIS